MKVNTSLIETDMLLTLVKVNTELTAEVKELKKKVENVQDIINGIADTCISKDRWFKYSDVPVADLCKAIGLDCEEINDYVEKAKGAKNEE